MILNPLALFLKWWRAGYPTEWAATDTLFRKRSIVTGKPIKSPYCMVRCINGQLQYREMTEEEALKDERERAW